MTESNRMAGGVPGTRQATATQALRAGPQPCTPSPCRPRGRPH
ncbi:hypothetical protein ACOZ4Y_10480 [Komagataeibacter rhaeticus]|nr:hypothetical protein [Komagataeibacter rhaeticus]MDT8870601.1 hypothetical protein [Komagataeibacter rhaeticus]WPP20854.1 hypothetical protein SCD25_10330 [Komagataeibacter rhaeticus]